MRFSAVVALALAAATGPALGAPMNSAWVKRQANSSSAPSSVMSQGVTAASSGAPAPSQTGTANAATELGRLVKLLQMVQ